LSTFELTISPRGYYHGYNASVNPTVANEVASAAFRFGHSLVNSSIGRCNKEFRDIGFEIDLFKEMNNPANLHNFGSVDRIMLGLSTKNMRLRDEFITDMLTNHLFQVRAFSSLFCFFALTFTIRGFPDHKYEFRNGPCIAKHSARSGPRPSSVQPLERNLRTDHL
jgi:hypothetical protein